MNFTLRVWRQEARGSEGVFETYEASDVDEDDSFLEMMDELNDRLTVQDMVEQMDAEGFGGCTNFGECEAACPEEISIRVIGRLNRDFLIGSLYHPRNPRGGMKPQ